MYIRKKREIMKKLLFSLLAILFTVNINAQALNTSIETPTAITMKSTGEKVNSKVNKKFIKDLTKILEEGEAPKRFKSPLFLSESKITQKEPKHTKRKYTLEQKNI